MIDVGDVRLTRVLYLEAAIDPLATGLTPDEVRAVPWAEPGWADDGQVRAASCAWVVEAGGRRIVVDPAGNLDEIIHDPGSTALHQQAYTDAFAAAGATPAWSTPSVTATRSPPVSGPSGPACTTPGTAPSTWAPGPPSSGPGAGSRTSGPTAGSSSAPSGPAPAPSAGTPPATPTPRPDPGAQRSATAVATRSRWAGVWGGGR